MHYLIKRIDFLIYLFIGPFAVLYIIPQFFLTIEKKYLDIVVIPEYVKVVGSVVMYLGALLAIWCTIVMWFNKRNTPNVFSSPRQVVSKGPYGVVRHPMMWSLIITLFGEVIVFLSPTLLLWLMMWIRFSVLYVKRYEEPYLYSIFGERYTDYCKKTPRWIPHRIKSSLVKE